MGTDRQKHTPGPWGWFGNAGSNSIYLATNHSGRRYVMDFTRWGFNRAQPRFQPSNLGMVAAKDLLQFEVGDRSVVGVESAKQDTSVYRYDVRGIACADAHLIAAAPELFEALAELIYEATHLSPREDDGSHKCRITAPVLAKARAALSKASTEGGTD